MEKAEGPARPAWLAEGRPAAHAGEEPKPEPAARAVPWRTPGSPKPAAPTAKPAAAKAIPAKPTRATADAPAAAVPVRWPARRAPLWERLLPLVFLLIFVLVVGGYLAGRHLG